GSAPSSPATSRACSWPAAIPSAASRPPVRSRWSSNQAESSGTMLLVNCDRAELDAFYRRYLQRCNEHRFGELGEFVGENVEVNGEGLSLRPYAEGLDAVIALVPDYHWDVRHLLVDDCWLSAHWVGAGTSAPGH